MTKTRIALLSAMVLAGPATAQESDPELSAEHVARAETAAGEDLTHVLGHCSNIGKPFSIPAERGEELLDRVLDQGEPRPYAVFDNLYFLGTGWVTSWAVTTSDGIILIDALNNDEEAARYIEGGMETVGLDPTDIEKIIVLHAHGDHYGGVNYLKEKYGADVIMSEADWQVLEQPELQFDSARWGRPPARDVSVTDGDTVTLGDTTIKLLVTPGHTPGTLSAILPVTSGDTAHKAVVWGGNGLNFGPDAERFVQMIESQRRIAGMAEEEGLDVFLSNHQGLDGTLSKIDEMEAGVDGNPFVIGPDAVTRAMTALSHCVAAQLASFDPASVPEN